MTTLSAAVILFLVMDPLGNLPIFFSALKDLPVRRKFIVLARELLIALAVLFAFLFAGQAILDFLHLRTESIRIAGGIVLFLIGVRMVFPSPDGIFGDTGGGEPLIVPLAIPSVAGPSAMATLLLLANDQPGELANWSIALLGAWGVTAAILFGGIAAQRYIGHGVLTAFERLMGMILIALSVQMTLDGTQAYLALSRAGAGA